MLIMSATAHVVALRPAALVGFPVMIIGATALILVLLYLVGPEQEAGGGDPIAAAVNHALIPAIAIDPQTGRILAANHEAAELLGRSRVALGNHFGDLFVAGSAEGCRRIVDSAVDRGEFRIQPCSVRTRTGEAIVVELVARLMELDRSSFMVIGLSTNDVSATIAQFARVQERLMSNISHELRTPLNVVMGFSELLTTGTLGELADNQLDAAQECHEGGERMLRLINDILDVGRSRSYYLDGETRTLSPLEMIHRVENLLSGQARREELALKFELDDSLPVIETEERAFKQLVYHLILNSIRRSDPGDTVRIVARRDDGHMIISVSDSGGPINEEIRPQPDPSVSEKEAAEALAPPLLGLPLSATLAERLGASLSIDSDEEGMHFIVTMPLLRS